jgi:hypothetical protein
MPLTKGSQPMKPMFGLSAAVRIRCSPPPKPISSQMSVIGLAKSARASPMGAARSIERRGSSSSMSRA